MERKTAATNFLAERSDAADKMKILFQAVQQSTNVVIITNRQGSIEYVNPQFCRVTGYTEQEAIGENPRILRSGSQPDAVYKSLWQTVLRGESWSGEFYNRTKSGGYYWANAVISPVKNEAGEIIHLMGIQEDITQRKLVDQELQHKTAELEEMLRKLQQTQGVLIQQEKMAGLGQLAAGVAHEINNPLGFIMSNLNTLQSYVAKISEMLELGRQLRSQVLKSDVREARLLAERIEQQAQAAQLAFILDDLPALFKESGEGMERVGKIVKSLRAFARIDQLGEKEQYNLLEGIRNTLLIANSELKYVADVVTQLEPVQEIEALGGEVNQVLLNIIMNAVQAIKKRQSGSGLGRITLKSWQEAEYVCCSIADSGGGISEEHLTRIFNPFFTTKPVGEGTGLGLSISYDIIVKRHGGKLWAENKEDGAVFYIKLPIVCMQNSEIIS
ncbi:PAS domain-containing sensor histidine kinase [Azotosporobacter soli]|uniref:PAS domain-containing sensor histidine kinase n=1 Tax=Azotosporobacter soli TaxID=3055040 RepID=UPI0031FE9AA8